MAIDRDKALSFSTGEMRYSYGEDDVILYNLGIGWGTEATDPTHLSFVYENGLQVFPTFGVVPSFAANIAAIAAPGLDVNPMMVLHGEQSTEILAPIPTRATLVNTGKIAEVYDKGKGALIIIEVSSKNEKDGTEIFRNRFSIFARGAGGFGGPSGPKPGNNPPEREPDAIRQYKTRPDQALLYRLSGDKNPLHADPSFAKMGGFDTPILHGLCTYGIVGRAVFDEYCEGDAARIKAIEARFSKHVFPGETIEVSMWRDGNTVIVSAATTERGEPVISNAAIHLHS